MLFFYLCTSKKKHDLMIKLIATDLDGTLLDDNKNIHPSFWETFEKLKGLGVLFLAASGRQYFTLHEQFKAVENDIILLAENGTLVKHRDEAIFLNDLPIEHARFFIHKARQTPRSDVILCGMNSAYVDSRNPDFWEDAAKYYRRLQFVDDIAMVDDIILKVTLWDHVNAEQNSYTYFKDFEGEFNVAVAGDSWLDITNKTASKGTAIDVIQNNYGISPEETLVFGDHLNDKDMMRTGYYSYAMKNAHPKIKEISRFITRNDNNHNGVVETINELFGF
jgi:Cof subfamily protein (haloacid dehalogenase superfamily)